MFTADQYRAKAAEYASYVKTAQSPSETREFQNLERVYRSLAENAEWLAGSLEQTMPAMVHDLNEGTALTQEEEQMLGCVGAAVMMRWDTLPAKIQRDLFECAISIGDLRQSDAGTDRTVFCTLMRRIGNSWLTRPPASS
jgi:hypothetical protein